MTINQTPHSRFRWLPAALVQAAFVALPTAVMACPVCFSAKGKALVAFYGTAILLSLLPFAMVGGLAYYVYRCAQRQETDGQASTVNSIVQGTAGALSADAS